MAVNNVLNNCKSQPLKCDHAPSKNSKYCNWDTYFKTVSQVQFLELCCSIIIQSDTTECPNVSIMI